MGEGETPEYFEPVEKKTERWGYETHLKPYLLALAKDAEDLQHGQSLESLNNFPKTIELPPAWHETLNLMRKQSNDGNEHYTVVGYNRELTDIYVSNRFFTGTRHEVTYSLTEDAKDHALMELKWWGIIADIHTHPPQVPSKIPGVTAYVNFFDVGIGAFSWNDFYNQAQGMHERDLRMVADPAYNLLVFRTKETVSPAEVSGTHTLEEYDAYWKRRGKIISLGFNKSNFPLMKIDRLNRMIAEEYNLALYRGRPGEDVKRLYPPA